MSEPSGKRYIPVVRDIVIGVIVAKTSDNFKVDIAAPSQAVLSNTAFNSASKRHRPNLKVGQVVICQVIAADLRFDIELSCEDPTTPKDWVTNEVYFGQLPDGGMIVPVSTGYSKRLLEKHCPVFPILGQYLKPFETAIGANGRIYIRTADSECLRAVLVGEALRKAETMTLEDIEKMCKMGKPPQPYWLD